MSSTASQSSSCGYVGALPLRPKSKTVGTSAAEAADEVSKFFVAPLLDFHRRLLAEGIKAGEFRHIDPVLFYTSLIGACDHLFFGRHAMSRATGVGPVTDEVCRQYIKHMEALIFGGMLATNTEETAGMAR